MSDIILTEEQAQLVFNANSEIQVRDTQGRLLGRFTPELTLDEMNNIKQALSSDQPRYSTEEVIRRLTSVNSLTM